MKWTWLFEELIDIGDVGSKGSVLGPIRFVLSSLFDVISRHAMSRVSYGDDTQLRQSAPHNELSGLQRLTQKTIKNKKQ